MSSTIEREPQLSVVVASMNGYAYLSECLAALYDDCPCAEVIVADSTDDETRQRIRMRFPAVEIIAFERPTAVPTLRAAGITAARAPYVAVIEDPCVVTQGWCNCVIDAHRRGHSIVGGPIRNGATDRVRDWAAFLCEYSDYLEPVPAGSRSTMVGMNVSYDRRALDALRELLPDGHWEFPLHAWLRSVGFQLHSEQTMAIEYLKTYGFREFFVQSFDYSLSFARVRSNRLGWRRVVYAVGSPLLVPYLYARIARNVLGRRRFRKELLLATPLLAVYLTACAAGQMLGYGIGPMTQARKAA